MNDLLSIFSDYRRRYVIPEEICKKYKFNLEWSQSLNGLTKGLIKVYGFIYNVPSDRNILGLTY